MKEIVTIQVGEYANFIGSHFWNFQDELLGLLGDQHADPIYRCSSFDMDVLYRTGETQQGLLTYNPRLISIGVQGSLGSLSISSSLYGNVSSPDPSDVGTWRGNVSRQTAEPHKKNLFLQRLYEDEHRDLAVSTSNASEDRKIQDKDVVDSLENSVQFWTDFSKVQYHSRSLYELHGLWTDVRDFDNYGVGKDAVSDGSQKEEMYERLRFFVEESDNVQGIQCIVDDSGGFSAVACDFLEHIEDEYTHAPVLLYSARDPMSYAASSIRGETISRSLHDAVSFSKLSSVCKLMVPIGLPSISKSKLSSLLHVKDTKSFHTSAVYAASIHSISLPFRLNIPGPTTDSIYAYGALDIGELIHILAGQGRQSMVPSLDVAMPALSLSGSQGSILRNMHSLTPETEEDIDDQYAVESFVIHGAFDSGSSPASISRIKESVYSGYESVSPRPMFSHLSASLCALPIPLPFPSIFASHLGEHGEVTGRRNEGAPPKGALEISSVPMAARLRSSKAIVPFIERRLQNLRRYGIDRGAQGCLLLHNWGCERAEVEEMGESMTNMLMPFNPCSDMSSDSD